LQLLVRQAFALVRVMAVMAVMAVVRRRRRRRRRRAVVRRMRVMMVSPRGPDVHGVEQKRRKAAEQHAGACNGAEAAKCVVRISPARSPDAHCLD
jgi:hypothetical protein